MKTILFCVFATAFTSITALQKETKVFVCKSKAATRYHLRKDCSGLKKCHLGIAEITLAKAKELERTLCKLERKSN